MKVNGKESNRFRTNDMIFGIKPFIAELTKYFTLWPGDVIWMGTDGASPDLKAGDVVEIEITGIGTLRNQFVAETAPGSHNACAATVPRIISSKVWSTSAWTTSLPISAPITCH